MVKCIVLAAFLFSGLVRADTISEDFCFVNYSSSSTPIRLALRTYLDNDIQEVIGAVARYGTSMDIIPLVFSKSTTNKNGFEERWLEVYGGNITGEYIYEKSGVGGGISAYSLSYKNYKTGKSLIFLLSPGRGECPSFKPTPSNK